MKPFSITAPEEIAKEYGGDKRKIQQAAAQGIIDPTSAVLAGMFIDRIRGAAQAEQANQPTVAEQVMAPQPQPQQQIPSAGLAASPQAAQMQQPMAPRMGQPAMGRMPQPAPAQMPPTKQPPMQQPMGMAMGGGLDSIDFVEGSYAPGGVVGFSAAGGVSADREALLSRRNQLEADLRTARIQGDRNSLTQQINAIDRQLANSTNQALPGIEQGKAMERQAQAEFAAAANQQMPNLIAGGTPYPQVPTTPGQLEFELPSASPYGPESSRIDPNRFDTGTLTEEEAMRIEGGEEGSILDAITPERPVRPAGEFIDKLGRFLGGPKLVAPEDRVGLMELLAGRNVKVGADDTTPTASAQVPSTQEDRRGSVAEQIARMREGAQEPSSIGRRITDPAEIAALEASTAPTTAPAGRRITDPAEIAALEANTQGPGTIADQIAEQQTTPATTEPAPAAEVEPKTDAEESEKSIEDYYNELSELRGEEVGPATRELQESFAKRADTMSAARKDAFNMALLQTGLGMLSQKGQPGGTLQALGKAALPAVKEATKAIKDAKKEDRELLKIGAGLEQAEGKRRDNMIAAAVKKHGADKTMAATLQAAEINANRETDFDKNIAIRVEGFKNADRIKGDKIKSDDYYKNLALQAYDAQQVRERKAGATITAESRAASQAGDTEDKIRKDVADYRAKLETDRVIINEARVKGIPVDEYINEKVASYEAKRRGTDAALQVLKVFRCQLIQLQLPCR